MSSKVPLRGQVWLIEFSPSVGREIKYPYPALVVSDDELNKSAWGLIVVCPITILRKEKPFRLHVPILPPEIKHKSIIRIDQIKSLSVERFINPLGTAKAETMQKVEFVLKKVLSLY